MVQKDFKKWYAEISSNLASRRLKPAFDLLGKTISEYGLGIYYDEYRSLEETYHFMLKYTVEGIKDPERKKIYQKLIVSVYELADKINEELAKAKTEGLLIGKTAMVGVIYTKVKNINHKNTKNDLLKVIEDIKSFCEKSLDITDKDDNN